MNAYQHLPLLITLSAQPPVHFVGVEMERTAHPESLWVFPPLKGSLEGLGPGKQWLESITFCLPSLLLFRAHEQCSSPKLGHSHAFNSPSSAELLLSGQLCLLERVTYKGARENCNLGWCKTPAVHMPSPTEVCQGAHMPPLVLGTPASTFSTAPTFMLFRNNRHGEKRWGKAQRECCINKKDLEGVCKNQEGREMG